MDKNLWHLSHEGVDLEDTWNPHPTDIYQMTVAPEDAPDKPEQVEIAFEKGVPIKLNGVKADALTIIEKLNEIGGRNGVGIIDMVENRLVGMKSRGVYETPGGTILYTAHKELEYITLDKETMRFKQMVSDKYADLVYNGQWHTPLKEALDAFVDSTQQNVTGVVLLKLYKGSCTVIGMDSIYSLYNKDFATFGENVDNIYNQKDAEGFINLFGLPIEVQALMKRKLAKQQEERKIV
jgi:argininosuccinate synthase